jgi:hypothetical protein
VVRCLCGTGGACDNCSGGPSRVQQVRRPSPSIPPGSPSPPSLRRSRPKWARAASRARRRSQRTEQSVSRSPVSPRACAPGSNLVPPGLRSERAWVAQSGACSDRGTDVSPDPVSAEPARCPRDKIPSRRSPLPASAAQNVDTGGVDLVGEWAPHGVSWTGSRGTGCAMRSTQSRQCPSERTQTVAAPRFLRPSSPRVMLSSLSPPLPPRTRGVRSLHGKAGSGCEGGGGGGLEWTWYTLNVRLCPSLVVVVVCVCVCVVVKCGVRRASGAWSPSRPGGGGGEADHDG